MAKFKFVDHILQNTSKYGYTKSENFSDVFMLGASWHGPYQKFEKTMESLLIIMNNPMYYKSWNIAMRTTYIGMDTFLRKKSLKVKSYMGYFS